MRVANSDAQYATTSRTTRLSPKDSQVALPAEKKTRSGSSAIAALGAMLATDWARTSGKERTLACKLMPESTVRSVWAVAMHPFLLFMAFIVDVDFCLVMVAVAAGLRVVKRRVADEEAGREQLEADRVDRHDRPVLGAGDVVGAEGEPEHHVGVGEAA